MPTYEERVAAAGFKRNKDGSTTMPKRDPERLAKLVRENYLDRVVWIPPLDTDEWAGIEYLDTGED